MKQALEGLPGVIEARVDLGGGRADVRYMAGRVEIARMIEAVRGRVILPRWRRFFQAMARVLGRRDHHSSSASSS